MDERSAAPELAVEAGRTALERAGVGADRIGLIAHAWIPHQGHDFWSSAHCVASSLGARNAEPIGDQQMYNGGAAALRTRALPAQAARRGLRSRRPDTSRRLGTARLTVRRAAGRRRPSPGRAGTRHSFTARPPHPLAPRIVDGADAPAPARRSRAVLAWLRTLELLRGIGVPDRLVATGQRLTGIGHGSDRTAPTPTEPGPSTTAPTPTEPGP